MSRVVSLTIMSAMMITLFTGCTQRELLLSDDDTKPSKHNVWADERSVDDVDVSDLEESFTESEMMMTEDMQDKKMDRKAFPLSEYSRLARTGKGTVQGTIYLSGAYDKRVLASGTRLYLNPVTSYSDQWYKESYVGGYKMKKADSRLFNYLRFTASDSNGRFSFYGVPSGSYYLIGTVQCGEECGYGSVKNIRIATKVDVYGNQIVEKDLTRIVE